MLAQFGEHGGRTRRVTDQMFNQRMERRRNDEFSTNKLRSHAADDMVARAHHTSQRNVEGLRRKRRIQQQNQELRQGQAFEAQFKAERERAMLAEQDNRLAKIMYDMDLKKRAEEASKRRICEESEELTSLRQLLMRAEVTKARAVQLAEKELIAKQTANREARVDAMMEDERRAAIEREYEEARMKHEVNMKARLVLQDQIRHRLLERQRAYEEHLKEKAIVDEVVRGLEVEDRAKAAYQKKKQRELQANIQKYLRERALWRQEQQRKAEEELKKIQDYNALQEKRAQDLANAKQAATDAQDVLLQKLTREIEAKRKEEEDMKQLLYELYQEEARAKADEAEQKKREAQERSRQEMLQANEYQKILKARKQMQLQEEEEAFRKKMMDKFMEDDRIAQMNAARRRREMIEYKKEVEKLIEERKRRFEEAMQKELKEREDLQAKEEYRKSVIEAERQRLLSERAAELLDYLPKGVLQTQTDLQKLATIRGRQFQSSMDQKSPVVDRSRPNNGVLPGMSSNYTDTRFRDLDGQEHARINPAQHKFDGLLNVNNYNSNNNRGAKPQQQQQFRQSRPQQQYQQQQQARPSSGSYNRPSSGYNPITGQEDMSGSQRLSRRPSAFRREQQQRPF